MDGFRTISEPYDFPMKTAFQTLAERHPERSAAFVMRRSGVQLSPAALDTNQCLLENAAAKDGVWRFEAANGPPSPYYPAAFPKNSHLDSRAFLCIMKLAIEIRSSCKRYSHKL
jgi:hypothetical protein